MIIEVFVPPIAQRRFRRVGLGLATRLVVALGLVCLLLYPVMASDRPALRAEITVQRDVVALGDLLEGVRADLADRPVFRAPALGETGTIQAVRITDMARDLGAGVVETLGLTQVVVTRAARRIDTQEIDAALRKALESRSGLDARNFTVVFDGTPPSLLTDPAETGEVEAKDVVFDPRSRRVVATLAVGTGAEIKRLRVSGQAVERRARDSVSQDARIDVARVAGQVARRPLSIGTVIRTADLTRPEIVARNETVLITYETPGLVLTLRGKANEAGALGDSITVVNLQSKKTLQATVAGPGRVRVTAPGPGRVASAY